MAASNQPFRPAALNALLPAVLATACTPGVQPAPQQPPARSYYLTAPGQDTSPELGRILGSVHQIDFTAEYTTYAFDERSGVTEADIYAGGFEARADTTFAETLSKAGTATVIGRSGDRITLLTVSHVVRFPAIRFQYFEDPAGQPPMSDMRRRVASASVRFSERGRFLPRSGPLPFDVAATDERNDLALLRVTLPGRVDPGRFPVLEIAAGNAHGLAWGSFVYVLGFPRGYAMVTRAIVSSPDRDGRGAFLTDAIWNEGMSGGPIVAIRGDNGNLELVGLARASAAAREILLRPDTTGITPGSPIRRYDGPLWLETGLRPQYGISLPVPMTAIEVFLARQGLRLGGV